MEVVEAEVVPLEAMIIPHLVVEDQAEVVPLEAMMFPHVAVEDQAEVAPQAEVMDPVEAAAQGVMMTGLVATRNMAVGLAVDGVKDLLEVAMTPRPTTSQ